MPMQVGCVFSEEPMGRYNSPVFDLAGGIVWRRQRVGKMIDAIDFISVLCFLYSYQLQLEWLQRGRQPSTGNKSSQL